MKKRNENKMMKGISHVHFFPLRCRPRNLFRHAFARQSASPTQRVDRRSLVQEGSQTRSDRQLRLSRHSLSLSYHRLAWRACDLGNCQLMLKDRHEGHLQNAQLLITEVTHAIPRLVHERYGRASADRPLSVSVLEFRSATRRERLRSKRTDTQPYFRHRWLLTPAHAEQELSARQPSSKTRLAHKPERVFLRSKPSQLRSSHV